MNGMEKAVKAAKESSKRIPEQAFHVVILNGKHTVVCNSFFNSQFSRGVKSLYATL